MARIRVFVLRCLPLVLVLFVVVALLAGPDLAARAAGVNSSGALGHLNQVTKQLYKPGAGVILALAPIVALVGAGMLLTGGRNAVRTLGMGIGIFAVVAAIPGVVA